jgi:hypothetical protein
MNINYLKTFPLEILEEIMSKLDVKDIFSLCSTDEYIRNLCNNDTWSAKFWKNYIFMNYSDIINLAEYEQLIEQTHVLTWKKVAKTFINGKPLLFEVYNKTKVVSINYNMYIIDIINLLSKIHLYKDINYEEFTFIIRDPVLLKENKYNLHIDNTNNVWLTRFEGNFLKKYLVPDNITIGKSKFYDQLLRAHPGFY